MVGSPRLLTVGLNCGGKSGRLWIPATGRIIDGQFARTAGGRPAPAFTGPATDASFYDETSGCQKLFRTAPGTRRPARERSEEPDGAAPVPAGKINPALTAGAAVP